MQEKASANKVCSFRHLFREIVTEIVSGLPSFANPHREREEAGGGCVGVCVCAGAVRMYTSTGLTWLHGKTCVAVEVSANAAGHRDDFHDVLSVYNHREADHKVVALPHRTRLCRLLVEDIKVARPPR